ncbi:uncharacterized protein LOC126847649, partial [Adelges cooleyi]
SSGDLDCLKYALKNGFSSGDLDCLKYALKNGF